VIRLLLADDENLIRSALAALLGLEDDLHVVAQAASGDEALAMARAHRPDVAVLDLQMPAPDGIAVAEVLRAEMPHCASIIVTSHGRPGHLKRALAAGVRGFLPKTVSAQVLADVVRTARRGGRYVDPELAAEAISAGDSPLTPREADVLESPPTAPASTRSPPAPVCPPEPSGTTCPRRRPSSAQRTGTRPSMSPGPTAGSERKLAGTSTQAHQRDRRCRSRTVACLLRHRGCARIDKAMERYMIDGCLPAGGPLC
jgi:two-component system, NarL family, response regulator DesR